MPQGLPLTVTSLLSIAAKRMANRNVLVKDLQGVETLGAITLLATGKNVYEHSAFFVLFCSQFHLL